MEQINTETKIAIKFGWQLQQKAHIFIYKCYSVAVFHFLAFSCLLFSESFNSLLNVDIFWLQKTVTQSNRFFFNFACARKRYIRFIGVKNISETANHCDDDPSPVKTILKYTDADIIIIGSFRKFKCRFFVCANNTYYCVKQLVKCNFLTVANMFTISMLVVLVKPIEMWNVTRFSFHLFWCDLNTLPNEEHRIKRQKRHKKQFKQTEKN